MISLTCFYCSKPYDRIGKPKCECSEKVWLHPRDMQRQIDEAEAAQKERDAKVCEELASQCNQHGTEHFCELFGCQSFDEAAASIRASDAKGAK